MVERSDTTGNAPNKHRIPEGCQNPTVRRAFILTQSRGDAEKPSFKNLCVSAAPRENLVLKQPKA